MENKKEVKRAFKGVWIPKGIYLNENLSWSEKILLVEIESLDNEDGCFASNKYFSKFLGISEGRIANLMTGLRKKGFVEDIGFDGRNRSVKVNENVKAEFTKTGRQSSGKSEPLHIYNNTSNNTDTFLSLEDQFKKALNDFRIMRKQMKKPMTERAEELLLAELGKYDLKTAIIMLEKSILHNWLGVFPLKPEDTPVVPKKTFKLADIKPISDAERKANIETLAKMKQPLLDKIKS